jgi:hypothetical protein
MLAGGGVTLLGTALSLKLLEWPGARHTAPAQR